MSRFSLAARISAVLALTLGLLVALAAVSYLSTASIGGTFSEYRNSARQSLFMNALAEDLFEARMASFKYRLTESEAAAADVRSNVQEIADAKKEAESLMTGEAGSMIRRLIQDSQGYVSAFEKTLRLQSERNKFVEKIEENGTKARRELTGIMQSAYNDGDSEAAYYAGLAQQELLLARYYAKTYLLKNDDTSYQKTRKHIETAEERMVSMLAALQNPARRAAADKVQSYFAAFGESFAAVKGVIVERNAIRAGELDTIGPRLQGELETILDRVVDRQNTLGPNGVATVETTLTLVVAIAIGALLIGATGGAAIARRMSRDVAGLADTMKTLAEGDLQVEVAGAEHEHELGRMAQALQVFKANAERVASLRQEQERQEAQTAEERAAMMEELRRSFGAVVDAAVAGDFSLRVEATFADAELNELANGVNRLLETVNDGVEETGRVMSQIAQGDLRDRMHGSFQGAFAELKQNVNETVQRLSSLVEEISGSVQSVGEGAGEIATGADDLSSRAEQQASSLEETAATMEEMSASIKSNADNSASAQSLAMDASGRATEGGRIVKDAVSAMGEIETSAGKIADIIAVIDGIAFQTNLLALNAAVEAARAGDAGKGFAVVASEVRALAQRSSEASRDIRGLIETSAVQVSEGVRLVTSTGEALEGIVSSIAQVEGAIENIASSSREQASGVEEISASVSHMDEITQQNSTLAEQSASNARSLAGGAETLRRLISFFKVDGQTLEAAKDGAWREAEAAVEPVRPPEKAAAAQDRSAAWAEF